MAPGPPRIASFLQCKTPRGLIIPCKNAGILFRESSAEERSDDGAEKREKREERREKMATSSIPCISTVSRGHLKEVMKIRWGAPKYPQARIPAFLRCPVNTSQRTEKTPTSVRGSFSQIVEKQRAPRRGSQARFPAFLRCPVTTSMGAKTQPKKRF